MKYDKYHVGEKIAEMRNRMNLTQVELIEKCRAIVDADSESVPFSLRTLGSWENGNDSITLKNLILISQALECSVGYLLGEYDKRTLEAEDICNTTGLSEAAVNELLKDNKQGFISYFIENGKDIFATLGDYVLHDRQMQKIESLNCYSIIKKAFEVIQEKAIEESMQGEAYIQIGDEDIEPLHNFSDLEDAFFSLLRYKLNLYYTSLKQEEQKLFVEPFLQLDTEIIEEIRKRIGDFGTNFVSSFICRCLMDNFDVYNVLEMEQKNKYFRYELSDNFMNLADGYRNYVKEGAEDGREN